MGCTRLSPSSTPILCVQSLNKFLSCATTRLCCQELLNSLEEVRGLAASSWRWGSPSPALGMGGGMLSPGQWETQPEGWKLLGKRPGPLSCALWNSHCPCVELSASPGRSGGLDPRCLPWGPTWGGPVLEESFT